MCVPWPPNAEQPTSEPKGVPVAAETAFDSGQHSQFSAHVMDADNDSESFPEGGPRAYVSLVGSFLGLMVAWGFTDLMGTAMVCLIQYGVKTPVHETWRAFAMYITANYVVAVFTGPLFDAYGPTVIMIWASVFIFVGMASTANAFNNGMRLLMPALVLIGLGNSLAVTPLIASITHWFKRRRARAMGIATAGGSIGGICFLFLLPGLDGSYGLNWTMCIFAFLNAAIMSLLTCCLRSRTARSVDAPKGWGEKFSVENLRFVFRPLSPRNLRSTPYIFVVLGGVFSNLSLILAMTYFGEYSYYHDMSFKESYGILRSWSVAGIGGKILAGFAADKIGCFNVNLVLQLLYCIATFVLWLEFGEDHKNLVAYAVIAGFLVGSISSLIVVCLAQISPPGEMGLRYGFLNFWTAVGCLILVTVFVVVIPRCENNLHCGGSVVYVGCLGLTGLLFWILARFSLVGIDFTARI